MKLQEDMAFARKTVHLVADASFALKSMPALCEDRQVWENIINRMGKSWFVYRDAHLLDLAPASICSDRDLMAKVPTLMYKIWKYVDISLLAERDFFFEFIGKSSSFKWLVFARVTDLLKKTDESDKATQALICSVLKNWLRYYAENTDTMRCGERGEWPPHVLAFCIWGNGGNMSNHHGVATDWNEAGLPLTRYHSVSPALFGQEAPCIPIHP